MTWAELERRLLHLCDVCVPDSKAGNRHATEALNCLWGLLGQVRHLAHLYPDGHAQTFRIVEEQLIRFERLAPAGPAAVNGPRGEA